MNVHKVEEITIPELQNVLMFDNVECEWRIGHARQVIAGDVPFLIACTVAEAHDMITEGMPLPVFADVQHWARLPDEPA